VGAGRRSTLGSRPETSPARESFFAKLAKTLLRGIRGASKAELRERIERHLQELNQEPVVMKWTYGLESLSVA
jgi:hypothetical protein